MGRQCRGKRVKLTLCSLMTHASSRLRLATGTDHTMVMATSARSLRRRNGTTVMQHSTANGCAETALFGLDVHSAVGWGFLSPNFSSSCATKLRDRGHRCCAHYAGLCGSVRSLKLAGNPLPTLPVIRSASASVRTVAGKFRTTVGPRLLQVSCKSVSKERPTPLRALHMGQSENSRVGNQIAAPIAYTKERKCHCADCVLKLQFSR